MNKTDKRIISLWNKGLPIKRIAKRIGRPNNIKRIIDCLERNKVIDYKAENIKRELKLPLDEII